MASPELQALEQMLRENRPLQEPSLDEIRQRFELVADLLPLPDGATAEPVDADGVPAEWVRGPGSSDDRTILHLHGGGYCIGSINTHRTLAARISSAAGGRVLVIDYRLGPEHPYPAAVDDAVTAYRWILSGGTDRRQVAISGDSAGGGLTFATLVALRDADEPMPGAAVALSPWVDLEGTGASMETRADADLIVGRDSLERMAAWYLSGADPRAPLASPLHADLAGLPPLLIQVGDKEVLLDDAVRIADRAMQAGVDATLEVWPEMIHVWQLFAMVPEAEEAVRAIGGWLRERLSSDLAAGVPGASPPSA